MKQNDLMTYAPHAEYERARAACHAAYVAYRAAEEAAFFATRDANGRVATLYRQMIDAEKAVEAARAAL